MSSSKNCYSAIILSNKGPVICGNHLMAILYLTFMLLTNSSHSQSESRLNSFQEINLTHSLTAKINVYPVGLYGFDYENLVIDIQYVNLGEDTLYLWIKNWRVLMLSDENDYFENYLGQYTWLNYLVFTQESLEIEKQTRLSHDHIIVLLNSGLYSIKKMEPQEKFEISLIIEDSQVVKNLLDDEYKLNILGCFGDTSDKLGITSLEWEGILYPWNRLFLINIPVEYKALLRGGTSHELRFSPEGSNRIRFPKMLNNSFFKNYLIKGLELE